MGYEIVQRWYHHDAQGSMFGNQPVMAVKYTRAYHCCGQHCLWYLFWNTIWTDEKHNRYNQRNACFTIRQIKMTTSEKYKWKHQRNTNENIREIQMTISEKYRWLVWWAQQSLTPEIAQPLKPKQFSPPTSGLNESTTQQIQHIQYTLGNVTFIMPHRKIWNLRTTKLGSFKTLVAHKIKETSSQILHHSSSHNNQHCIYIYLRLVFDGPFNNSFNIWIIELDKRRHLE